MQKLKGVLINNQTIIKTLFFISVSVLVLVEIFRLNKTISLDGVKLIFNKIPMLNLLVMFIIGIIAVLPMIRYDIILNRLMKTENDRKYIFETSWAINSINNLVGFAGIVDVGLRYSFYSKENSKDTGIQEISKVIPYFMSGLSVFGAISLVCLFCYPSPHPLRMYWPLLIAALLYLPTIFLISGKKSLTYFGQLSRNDRLDLSLTSILDWLGVLVAFASVGYLAGFSIPIYHIIPIYIVAVVVGMLSMIPGGLGSFDLILVAGLTSSGLTNSQAVLWLLLFRIFYYIIPFTIGLFFFVKYIGGRVNEKFEGIPSSLLSSLSSKFILFFIRLFGFFFLLSALIPDNLSQISLLNKIDPIHAQLIWQFPSIVLGVLFILLARAVENKLATSWPFGVTLVLLSLLYVNLGSIALFTSVLLLFILLILYFNKANFNRNSFVYSWESITVDTGMVAIAVLIYLFFNRHHVLGSHFNSLHLTHYLTIWSQILLATIIVVFVVHFSYLYLRGKQSTPGIPFSFERFSELISKYDVESDSSLAFLGDKYLYWYQVDDEDQVVFQYGQEGDKCVLMGEPIGNKKYFSEAITDFINAARLQNRTVIFYEVAEETTMMLHDHGYEFMKFGESAKVDLASFTIKGNKGHKFRIVINKFEKQGYSFEVLFPPYSDDLMKSLKSVSDQWLGKRREKGFSLGYFNQDYLQLAPIAVVRNQENRIIAFANFMPGTNPEIGTIDLMRYESDTIQNGIMDYLFVKLFLYFKEEGKAYFDLGMAPLSNVGKLENSFFQERLAYLIYNFTNKFYSFSGLRVYKSKYSPKWEAKYIVYPKQSWILYNMITIFKIDNRKIKVETDS